MELNVIGHFAGTGIQLIFASLCNKFMNYNSICTPASVVLHETTEPIIDTISYYFIESKVKDNSSLIQKLYELSPYELGFRIVGAISFNQISKQVYESENWLVEGIGGLVGSYIGGIAYDTFFKNDAIINEQDQ
jgi:hypothetical protein